MQTFLSHGDECTQIEAEALELASRGAVVPDEDAPLQIYNDMLDSLGKESCLLLLPIDSIIQQRVSTPKH